MKKCSGPCQQEKLESEFYTRKDRNKTHDFCKICWSERNRKKYLEKREYILLQQKKFKEDNYEQVREQNRRAVNKYYKNNLEWRRKIQKEKRSTPEYRKKSAERTKERRHNNPQMRIAGSLRGRLNSFIKQEYKSASTIELLGCSWEALISHLSSQFSPEMTLDNYGSVWEVDHIYAMNLFALEFEKSQKICCNYTNLKPLLITPNRQKQDFIPNKELNNILQSLKKSKYRVKLKKDFWKSLTSIELHVLGDCLFKHYSNREFPLPLLEKTKQDNLLAGLLQRVNNLKLIEDNIILLNQDGGRLCWHYFPHAWNIRSNNSLSPIETYNNKQILYKIIHSRLQANDSRDYFQDSALRKDIKSAFGTQGVSNFRPTAAYAIYHRYCLDNATVWDMSGGWGGRYLGALLCNKVSKYTATEPSTKTYEGLLEMSKNLTREGFTAEFHKLGSEDFSPEPNSLDVCFTSPPYFNCEKYSDESTQSYIKYPDNKQWLTEFLGKTIDNCYKGLKDGGYLIINIANVRTYKNLCEDFQELMRSKDFKYIEMLKYKMPSRTGGDKFEPVFVYRKIT